MSLSCRPDRLRFRRAQRSRGFSLLELMIVIVIVAITATVVTQALPPAGRQALAQQADQLAAALDGARALSRTQEMPVTFKLNVQGFEFQGLRAHDPGQGPQQWLVPGISLASCDGPFRPFQVGPEPFINRQCLVLSLEDQRAWLQSDGVGPFEVLNVPPTGARP